MDDSDFPGIDQLLDKARTAQREVASRWDQEAADLAVRALAWSVFEPGHARELAELAVETTGLGNVEDKVKKNQRKTYGTLRDLLRLQAIGTISDEPDRGLVKIAKPAGIVAALTPSTNPAATPINNAMMAINAANAIVFAPSPSGWPTTSRVVDHAREALEQIGEPADLVQILPSPVTRAATTYLMEQSDLVLATGAQENVRSAYKSGTPALGVGAGNVPVIIDASADVDDAAKKILASKTFDNATSCSAENTIIVVGPDHERALGALTTHGATLLSPDQSVVLRDRLFDESGQIRREHIAQDLSHMGELLGLDLGGRGYLLAPRSTSNVLNDPMASEKLSLVSTLYLVDDLEEAVSVARNVLEVQGIGHSVGVHTSSPEAPQAIAEQLPVVRVLVNQAHAIGNGGSFDNGLPFSLSMGCGTWAKNSISSNLNGEHFFNITHVVRTIENDEPPEDELFGALWDHLGIA